MRDINLAKSKAKAYIIKEEISWRKLGKEYLLKLLGEDGFFAIFAIVLERWFRMNDDLPILRISDVKENIIIYSALIEAPLAQVIF